MIECSPAGDLGWSTLGGERRRFIGGGWRHRVDTEQGPSQSEHGNVIDLGVGLISRMDADSGDLDDGAALTRQVAIREGPDHKISGLGVVDAVGSGDHEDLRDERAAADLGSVHPQGFVAVAITQRDEEAEVLRRSGDAIDDPGAGNHVIGSGCGSTEADRRQQQCGREGSPEPCASHGNSVGKTGVALPAVSVA